MNRGVATLTGISPVLVVADLDRAAAYYRDQLGFQCRVWGDPPHLATADRDEVLILLVLGERPEKSGRMFDVHVRVDDVEALYAEMQESGAQVDYPIYDGEHGFRDFGVLDPDGHRLAFGQPMHG